MPRRIDNWSLTSLQQRAGEDRRSVDQAREVLLAGASGKWPDAAAVRGDGTPDCRLTGGDWEEDGLV